MKESALQLVAAAGVMLIVTGTACWAETYYRIATRQELQEQRQRAVMMGGIGLAMIIGAWKLARRFLNTPPPTRPPQEKHRPMTPPTVLLALLAGTLFAPAAYGGPTMPPPPTGQWDMAAPLFYLSDNAADAYTIADSFQHNLCLGATGSGKSSTTARVLLSSMARAGYGGFLTCVKVTDYQDYLRILRQAGREKDIIRVTLDDDVPFRINFLEYEIRRSGSVAAEVLVHLFRNIQEVVERGKHTGGGPDPFWAQSSNKLLRFGSLVLTAAARPVSLPNIWRLAVEAPTSPQEVDDPQWRERSFLYRCLYEADNAPKTAVAARDFDQAANYYLGEHPRMGDNTRGSVLATFSAAISPFLIAPLRDLYQSNTNFVPEMCENGAIIILDIPVMGDYKELAQIAQVVFKLLWYRAMERRDVRANPSPVFFPQRRAPKHLQLARPDLRLYRARLACFL